MDKVLARCIEGDKWAWDAFVQRYASVIMAAVGRVLSGRGLAGDPQRVEDVCQEVFVRLIKNDYRLLRSYDPDRASIITWLTIIARSSAIDSLRKRKLRTVALEEAAPVALVEQGGDEGGSATEHVPAGLLSARQKLVLGLLFEREMATDDIAKLLGISAQTVRSTRHKAIQKLRKHFADPNSS